ncbi:MAG: GGDEF domain-containing protein [Rickettsiales bacterium]
MPIDYRTNDAVITICQNNKAGVVTISEVNDAASNIVGFNASELVNQPLSSILPKRISELLVEYTDFENDTNDVGAVLSKVQRFSIVGKNGHEKAYRIKILRVESSANLAFFSLVLQDTLDSRKSDAARKVIKDNFKGHESLDVQTQLPNRASIIKDIELAKHHGNSNNMLSCFAVLQIDGYNKLVSEKGNTVGSELLKYVATLAGRSLRPDDIVGIIGDGRVGVLLVDITRGSERLVLNRLRWQVAANPYIDASQHSNGVSVSIAFYAISGGKSTEKTVEQCEAALDKLSAPNTLVDAAA